MPSVFIKGEKMNKKLNKFKITLLSALSAVFLALIICASTLFPFFQVTIDKFFVGQGANMDSYDNTKAREVCEDLESEAVVLLKNENGTLPLKASKNSPAKVALFGVGSAHMKYAGSGSGGGNATGADTLKYAFEQQNVIVHEGLWNFYDSKGSTGSTGGFEDIGIEIGSSEVSIQKLSDSVKSSAVEYSDTGIYVLSRVGAEEAALSNKILTLTSHEERTLDFIVENFENVIVLINCSNTMELGFLDGVGVSRNTGESFSKYAGKIDAALWVGIPGYTGTNGIARVMTGDVTPSGRLPDTYAYDVDSAPSVSAVGNAEGIYIGYKWYETAAYEGVIDYADYTRDNAVPYTDTKIATGVQYPFGYGISYTTFKKEIVSSTAKDGAAFENDNGDTIKMKVKVTNTGSVAGKEVVQLYYTAPYTSGGIEKAHVNLLDFAKTDVIQPGRSQDVELSFKLSDMKSFDYDDANNNGFKGYELEKGEYLVRVLNNAHDWVNVDEDSSLTLNYNLAQTVRYEKDPETGVAVSVRFDDYANAREYISREKSFANLSADIKANDADLSYKPKDFSNEVNNYERYVDYQVEREDIITYDEVIGHDYDDEIWMEFIAQFSKTEMATLIAMGNFQTSEIEAYGVPKTLQFDGPAAIKDTYKSDVGCLLYPSEVTLAAMWSKEKQYEFGASAGDDAKQCGVTGWYAPGINLHCNAYGERNFEYFSEDPVLSGKLAAAQSEGTKSVGLLVVAKHLIDGMKSTVNEQSLRGIYARPFEIAIKEGYVKGLMTSSSLLGTWIGSVSEFLTDIIRGEWGFVGMITSDAASGFMNVQYGLRAGNDIWLATDNARYTTLVRDEKNIGAMQQACKNILYTISLSEIMLETNDFVETVSPSMIFMVVFDVIGAIGLCLCVFLIVKEIIRYKNANAITII